MFENKLEDLETYVENQNSHDLSGATADITIVVKDGLGVTYTLRMPELLLLSKGIPMVMVPQYEYESVLFDELKFAHMDDMVGILLTGIPNDSENRGYTHTIEKSEL